MKSVSKIILLLISKIGFKKYFGAEVKMLSDGFIVRLNVCLNERRKTLFMINPVRKIATEGLLI